MGDGYPRPVNRRWRAVDENLEPRSAALGYSGRGLSFATLVGRELSKLTHGASPDDLVLPIEEMRPLPFQALTPFVAAACIKYCDIVDRWMIRRHRNR